MFDIGGAHDNTIGEPESEPDSEPREAKQQPKVDVGDRDSDEGSADDGVVHAEENVLPVLPQESKPSIEEYRAKWERLLAQHSKPVEGVYSIGNLVPKPMHQLWLRPIRPSDFRGGCFLFDTQQHTRTTLLMANTSAQRRNRASRCASPSQGSLRRAESEVSSGIQ